MLELMEYLVAGKGDVRAAVRVTVGTRSGVVYFRENFASVATGAAAFPELAFD